MDKSKEEFTQLGNKLISFMYKYPTTSFRGRELARKLDVSPTAISNTIKQLSNKGLIKVEKDLTLSIRLNRKNEDVILLKRVKNLRNLYASGFVKRLSEKYLGSTIIVFGSYSYGEDIESSDIDIAIIGSKTKNIELEDFERKLNRAIHIHHFSKISEIHKNLKESIVNGIVLKGGIEL